MSTKATFRIFFFPGPANPDGSAEQTSPEFTGLSFWNARTLLACQMVVETHACGRGGAGRYRAVHSDDTDKIPRWSMRLHHSPAIGAALVQHRRRTFGDILAIWGSIREPE
jgi:hypothetical protein